MTAVLVLNIALIIAVLFAVVGGLGWSIRSQR